MASAPARTNRPRTGLVLSAAGLASVGAGTALYWFGYYRPATNAYGELVDSDYEDYLRRVRPVGIAGIGIAVLGGAATATGAVIARR